MTDIYKTFVNKVRWFDKKQFLIFIAYNLWSKFNKNPTRKPFNEYDFSQKATLPRIAFLAAAIAGDRGRLELKNDELIDLVSDAHQLLTLNKNEQGDNLYEADNLSFISNLKNLEIASDNFDAQYALTKYKLYPALRLLEAQNESFAFHGNAYIFLYRSFAIAEQLSFKEIEKLLTPEEIEKLTFNQKFDLNLLYFFAYILHNNGAINTTVLLTIEDKFKLKGINQKDINDLLTEFSSTLSEIRSHYEEAIKTPPHLRFNQPNLLRDKPLIKISSTFYIVPSPDHLIMKMSSVVINRIYSIKRNGKLSLGNFYGKSLTDYIQNTFLSNHSQFNYLNIDNIEHYPQDQKKADFIFYGKEHVLIVEVKAKIGNPCAKTLIDPAETANSIKRIIEENGYIQCEKTWRYMKDSSMDCGLTPIFIILINDDAMTLSKLCYHLYHHHCLKLANEKFPLELMSLHDFERLMLAFNDIDVLAEEIIQHQSNLKPDNTIPFSEHKRTNQIKFDHLAHFDRLTKVLKELSESPDEEIMETT